MQHDEWVNIRLKKTNNTKIWVIFGSWKHYLLHQHPNVTFYYHLLFFYSHKQQLIFVFSETFVERISFIVNCCGLHPESFSKNWLKKEIMSLWAKKKKQQTKEHEEEHAWKASPVKMLLINRHSQRVQTLNKFIYLLIWCIYPPVLFSCKHSIISSTVLFCILGFQDLSDKWVQTSIPQMRHYTRNPNVKHNTW